MTVIIDGTTGITTPGETNTGNLSVAGSTTLTTPLPVASGGTGASSLSGITTGTSTNLAGGSNGTIPYQSASGTTQMLAVGTSGQVLQTNGAGAPTWATPSSGALTLLSTVTASNSATVDVENTFNSTYDNYMIAISGLTVSVNYTMLYMYLKIGGTYASSGYYYSSIILYDSVAPYIVNKGTNTAQMVGSDNNTIKSQADASFSGNIWLSNPASTAFSKGIRWHLQNANSTGVETIVGGGLNAGTGALTGVRFKGDTGNIVAGKFRLYGISNS